MLPVLGLAVWPLLAPAVARAAEPPPEGAVLRVGVAGSEPFVVQAAGATEGISVEIWQAVAAQAGWRYQLQSYTNVPHALEALAAGAVDLVVGPISITAERARHVRFSQPYFQSSLSILSRAENPSLWRRVAPFFNAAFYYAVAVLLLVLALVGALVWLAERRAPGTQFPPQPGRGIANGIWFAVVTMSTVGYGDLAPKTRLGRMVTAIWIIVSVITASSLIAGIASTLTLTGLKTSAIENAEQLSGRTVAVLAGSPGEDFARRWGARWRGVESLRSGYDLLDRHQVDALIFDRPQLLYFLQQRRDSGLVVSNAEYMRQNYGFAVPLASALAHPMNVHLLLLGESGRVARIVRAWLGENQE